MTRPVRLWRDLTSGFWFLPSLIVTGMVGAAAGITELDRRVDAEARRNWPTLLSADASSSREILSSISSSIVTVAGVVFSITIVTLTLASTQYSSRVLRTFTKDKLNQSILGGLAGTFAYAITVLLTITGGEGAFVPSIAVLTGFLFALAAVFAFIVFLHNVATGIQASSIIAAITSETITAVKQTLSGRGRSARRAAAEEPDSIQWLEAVSLHTGYIESIDIEALARFGEERGATVRMNRGTGDFVIRDRPLISVAFSGAVSSESLAEEDVTALNRAHIVGRFRTVDDDPDFGIRQLVDIALKALSPSVNDTTTAVVCVDHLTAVLVAAAAHAETEDIRGRDGRLLVIVRRPTFEGLLAKAFDQIRQNGSGNVAVLTALLNAVETLAPVVEAGKRREGLVRQLRAIAEITERTILSPIDRQDLQERIEGVGRTLPFRDLDPGGA